MPYVNVKVAGKLSRRQKEEMALLPFMEFRSRHLALEANVSIPLEIRGDWIISLVVREVNGKFDPGNDRDTRNTPAIGSVTNGPPRIRSGPNRDQRKALRPTRSGGRKRRAYFFEAEARGGVRCKSLFRKWCWKARCM
jgi:hypothetical protein